MVSAELGADAEVRFDARRLRSGFVDEYLRDPAKLASNLMQGHAAVPLLASWARRLLARCQQRGWLAGSNGR